MQLEPLLDNAHVRVTRNNAPCASHSPQCQHRVFVALGDVLLASYFKDEAFYQADLKRLSRGDLQVYGPGDSYSAPVEGQYLEITIKGSRAFDVKVQAGEAPAKLDDSERIVIPLDGQPLRNVVIEFKK